MSEQNLSDQVSDALQTCVDRGMAIPFTVVAVGANGSLFALKFDGKDGHPIAEHYVNDTFRAPVNIIVVDANGAALRIVIGKDGDKTIH